MKYIGFYDFPETSTNRVSNLAATNKMNYIASAINKAGYKVEIISPSWIGEGSSVAVELGRKVEKNSYTDVIFVPSWRTKKKIFRNIKIIFSLFWLFMYLMIHTKKSEKIIAYHVPWISWPLRAAKFFKKFHIVLEVEEIYGEVWKESKKFSEMENKLIASANSYIFVSDILEKHINKKNKPYIILYGSYETVLKPIEKVKKDGIIRLLYAGSIDSTKGGAFNAVNSLKDLPRNYKLHIIGHGSIEQQEKLRVKINEINSEKGYEACVFDGTLHGQEYSNYLLQCDIALNPQKQGSYMHTAFPSKIISYLSHQLIVISTDIESVRNSEIAEYIIFLENESSTSISKAILDADLSLRDSLNDTSIIKKMDQKFVSELEELLN